MSVDVLQRKGIFFSACTQTNTQFPIPLALKEASGMPHERPEGPYSDRSQVLLEYTRKLKGWHIPAAFSQKEAAGAFDLWQKARALPQGMLTRVGAKGF